MRLLQELDSQGPWQLGRHTDSTCQCAPPSNIIFTDVVGDCEVVVVRAVTPSSPELLSHFSNAKTLAFATDSQNHSPEGSILLFNELQNGVLNIL
jgi:hypothetical protein